MLFALSHVLIVQRPSGSGRRLKGLQKLVQALETAGATVDILDGHSGAVLEALAVQGEGAGPHSYEQQFSVFARARFVVAAHGAALANLMLSDTRICEGVELLPERLASYVAGRWYQTLPVRVHPVVVKSSAAAAQLPANGMLVRNLRALDVELDTDIVDAVVRLWRERKTFQF